SSDLIQTIALPNQQPTQGEGILLIDDDVDVLETTAEVLESLGYHVIKANDGLQGLQYFEQHADISVIIVDVVMPHMGGIEFTQKIRENHPYIGIIFLTGYDQSATLSEQHIPHTLTLHKPIDFEKLQHAIQNMLPIAEPK
ncbi:MAG: response regulator, partial [Ghiorsea sp.]|nr:response regulator [Ghiorsea sp.]